MSEEKTEEIQEETPKISLLESEYLNIGHQLKYNLYLVSRSLLFSSLYSRSGDVEYSLEQTSKVLERWFKEDHSHLEEVAVQMGDIENE